MASCKFNLSLSVLVHAIFLFSSPLVLADDKENSVLQGINSYRTSLQLPALTKNDKAGCLADEVADKLQDQPCSSAGASSVQLSNYPELLSKCGIDINHTRDGAVLPVCVPKLVPTLVLTNYTHTQHAKYINDSRYTGVGIGSEDDWMVVVLSTNTPSGSFAGANSLMSKIGCGHCLMCFLMGIMLLFVVY
ncbi:uncharacterized GPI-anchored protein At5g19250 [Ricinus communis]|uniref:Uncharacterized GPI-anchored protein At5g19230-like domain-containing protein n=1 Tax=Ricinus communis TaxID=3988 RepID=B9RF49_RICCO|nr:uncharacterized GPI-anchored protein At5g19250 [Ricinus communis]EEF49820.1 conserved hypothetical protein [Ricinus communis]|eukprot:XP_002512368.1 uncharacterized GPI-anchored protein At5g19250 [Ricinus communis]